MALVPLQLGREAVGALELSTAAQLSAWGPLASGVEILVRPFATIVLVLILRTHGGCVIRPLAQHAAREPALALQPPLEARPWTPSRR